MSCDLTVPIASRDYRNRVRLDYFSPITAYNSLNEAQEDTTTLRNYIMSGRADGTLFQKFVDILPKSNICSTQLQRGVSHISSGDGRLSAFSLPYLITILSDEQTMSAIQCSAQDVLVMGVFLNKPAEHESIRISTRKNMLDQAILAGRTRAAQRTLKYCTRNINVIPIIISFLSTTHNGDHVDVVMHNSHQVALIVDRVRRVYYLYTPEGTANNEYVEDVYAELEYYKPHMSMTNYTRDDGGSCRVFGTQFSTRDKLCVSHTTLYLLIVLMYDGRRSFIDIANDIYNQRIRDPSYEETELYGRTVGKVQLIPHTKILMSRFECFLKKIFPCGITSNVDEYKTMMREWNPQWL